MKTLQLLMVAILCTVKISYSQNYHVSSDKTECVQEFTNDPGLGVIFGDINDDGYSEYPVTIINSGEKIQIFLTDNQPCMQHELISEEMQFNVDPVDVFDCGNESTPYGVEPSNPYVTNNGLVEFNNFEKVFYHYDQEGYSLFEVSAVFNDFVIEPMYVFVLPEQRVSHPSFGNPDFWIGCDCMDDPLKELWSFTDYHSSYVDCDGRQKPSKSCVWAGSAGNASHSARFPEVMDLDGDGVFGGTVTKYWQPKFARWKGIPTGEDLNYFLHGVNHEDQNDACLGSISPSILKVKSIDQLANTALVNEDNCTNGGCGDCDGLSLIDGLDYWHHLDFNENCLSDCGECHDFDESPNECKSSKNQFNTYPFTITREDDQDVFIRFSFLIPMKETDEPSNVNNDPFPERGLVIECDDPENGCALTGNVTCYDEFCYGQSRNHIIFELHQSSFPIKPNYDYAIQEDHACSPAPDDAELILFDWLPNCDDQVSSEATLQMLYLGNNKVAFVYGIKGYNRLTFGPYDYERGTWMDVVFKVNWEQFKKKSGNFWYWDESDQGSLEIWMGRTTFESAIPNYQKLCLIPVVGNTAYSLQHDVSSDELIEQAYTKNETLTGAFCPDDSFTKLQGPQTHDINPQFIALTQYRGGKDVQDLDCDGNVDEQYRHGFKFNSEMYYDEVRLTHHLKQAVYPGTVSNYSSCGTYAPPKDFSPEQELPFSRLVIFPNPASNSVSIELPKNSAQMKMFDSMGKLVFADRCNTSETRQTKTIDISELDPGVYVIHVNGEFGLRREQLIVTK